MKMLLTLGCFAWAISLIPSAGADEDWLAWRGPNANGVAEADQTFPTQWDATQNILWKSLIPGRGHSSPIVVGDRIFLTTADDQTQVQSLLCYDRATGKPLGKADVNQGGFNPKIHNKNSHATPTPASDGERVFVVFNHHNGVQLTAFNTRGNRLWQQNAGGFLPQAYQFGFAASPLLYGSTVIVSSEFESAGFLAAFDSETGARCGGNVGRQNSATRLRSWPMLPDATNC